VPFESVGEGSTCAGYGEAGGARESELFEELVDISTVEQRRRHARHTPTASA